MIMVVFLVVLTGLARMWPMDGARELATARRSWPDIYPRAGRG